MGNDVLSIVFLALICIVVFAIIYKSLPSELVMPLFALISVCLWVAYDYIIIQRKKAEDRCKTDNTSVDNEPVRNDSEFDLDQIDPVALENNVEYAIKTLDQGTGQVPQPLHAIYEQPRRKHPNEYDIDFHRTGDIKMCYKDMGSNGDTQIANRMKYAGLQPRMAIESRSRMNAEKFRQYLDEELAEEEKRDWWDVDNMKLERDM